MNISTRGTVTPENDPLGLGNLAAPRPHEGTLEQDWTAVSAALDAGDKGRRQWLLGGLAAAATVVFVLAVATLPRNELQNPAPGEQLAMEAPDTAPLEQANDATPGAKQPTTEDLIAMSQNMERQLQQLRSSVGSMSSELVVYQVELQDLIGQVDDALSMSPGSQALWGQRLGLQMDLMKLYRNQLRRDYSRYASM